MYVPTYIRKMNRKRNQPYLIASLDTREGRPLNLRVIHPIRCKTTPLSTFPLERTP